MDQNVALFLSHVGHPLVVLLEEMLNLLLGEVLQLVHLVAELRVVPKGSVQEGPADADSRDVMFLENVLRSGSVLVSQVESLLDEIDLWKFCCAGLFELLAQPVLLLLAPLTN
jgi:hypothetical protein